ncbi:unnamed protein product [Didymodactylos carnosus]|uniref:VWFA domain-containing protein n=1 Tax=Didymodactylos carnosus TaxID=1234261 RepID=A0A814NCW1_9BILA|nr:unnamed protein product [Didymodactylos carnosus]CAF1091764.1 unnamed protein product [Didymodactylos carnosus]CAF3613287.1 unnamed protein product [Didymodactylos carnosus]CAF3857241.1 unnamed protein product [Didymodactylos carnosus]
MNWWNNEEHNRSSLIEELAFVLGEMIFPLNKFTRRRAALRGSSVDMPGLIKAINTEWTHKKIFSAKEAGPKRDHALCFVLDVSASMFGSMANGLKDSLVVVIGACRRLELDNFSVIVFGKNVRLIKTHEQSWDASIILTLIEQLYFDIDDNTRDAHAIEVAIDLLLNTSTRGERKIFLFTDGYGHCGEHLPMVQQRAEDACIDLVAIAVGFDRVNLSNSYKRYVYCHSALTLPKLLRALFENEAVAQSMDWISGAIKASDQQNYEELNDDDSNVEPKTFYQHFRENKMFDSIKNLTNEREQALEQTSTTNISFDICFCLDCTGSMVGWLPHIKKEMKFRFAIVAYRDISDEPRFETQPFTDNVDQITTFLNPLKAFGGQDLPEDALGALDECANLTDWNSQANGRVIILIIDAPGHGRDLNNYNNDAHPNGIDSQTIGMLCDKLQTKNAEISLILCTLNPSATLKMQRAFESYYQQSIQWDITNAFSVVNLVDPDESNSHSFFHFVFVLDESTSMQNESWADLLRAYQRFLTQRHNDQGSIDLFSVVQFSTDARIVYQSKFLSEIMSRELTWKRGNTNYLAGLTLADSIIAQDRSNSSVIMIFMSDGLDQGLNPIPKINELRLKYSSNHRFVCHTVGFGAEMRSETGARNLLRQIATVGVGQMYTALDGLQLQQVFGEIAQGCTIVSDTLVKRFVEILSEKISMKLLLDFL